MYGRNMTEPEHYQTIEEVAEGLQVSDQTIRRWIKSGRLPAYKPGREWRIKTKDLEEFLEARSSPKVPARPSPDELTFNHLLAEESRESELAKAMIRRIRAALDDRIVHWTKTQAPTSQEFLEFTEALLAVFDAPELREASMWESGDLSFAYQIAAQRLGHARNFAAELAQSDATAEERRSRFKKIEGALGA
jgi:excisionase family DNA binding protein